MSKKISKNSISIKENLKSLIKINDLSFAKLSKKVNINLDTLKNYETDHSFPILKNIIKICHFFQISIDFFIFWQKCPYPTNLKLLSLAMHIENQNNQNTKVVQGNISAFLSGNENEQSKTLLDEENLPLISNINENLKMLIKQKEIAPKDLAQQLEVNPSQISHYQKKSIPPIEKLIKLSKIFNVSIHALATGQKLNYPFKNQKFKTNILNADQLLTLEQQKVLTTLMQAMLK